MYRGFLWAVFAVTMGSGIAFAQEVKIGFAGPFTGPSANSGLAMRQGTQLAIDEVNAKGGVVIGDRHVPIRAFFEDSQGRPEVGVAAAQRLLTREQVDILVADIFNSQVTLAVMELAGTFDKFMMSGQPVSDEIPKKVKSNPQKYKNFWKPGYTSSGYAQTVLGTVNSLVAAGKLKIKKKTFAFLLEDNDAGRGTSIAVRAKLEENGWTHVGTEVVPNGYSDFYPQLSKYRNDPPDIFLTLFTAPNSGAALVKQIKEQDFATFHFAMFYPTRPEFYQAAGNAAEGLVWAPLFFDAVHNPTQRALADRIRQTFNVSANADHALAYCITAMLLDNISRAGTVVPDKLSEAFATTDFSCAIGRWRFNREGHDAVTGADGIPMPAAQIQGGANYVIWPPSVATSDYKPPR
jgi:ABC-type branched-subunit amino acid transport system substrate-binding protein